MLAAVSDQQEVAGAQLGPALRALAPFVQAARLDRLGRLPVRALHAPRDHVLEAAEDRAAVALVLAEAKAVVRLDFVTAPRAADVFRSR